MIFASVLFRLAARPAWQPLAHSAEPPDTQVGPAAPPPHQLFSGIAADDALNSGTAARHRNSGQRRSRQVVNPKAIQRDCRRLHMHSLAAPPPAIAIRANGDTAKIRTQGRLSGVAAVQKSRAALPPESMLGTSGITAGMWPDQIGSDKLSRTRLRRAAKGWPVGSQVVIAALHPVQLPQPLHNALGVRRHRSGQPNELARKNSSCGTERGRQLMAILNLTSQPLDATNVKSGTAANPRLRQCPRLQDVTW